MKRREPLSPDLTPLIDIVFILLIFFIVTSVFKKEELALLLNLPASTAAPLEVERKQVTIEITPNKLAFRGAETTLDALEQSLSAIHDTYKPIIIRIDREVTYDKIVEVLDLLQRYRLNNLALVTKKGAKQ
jgi:biopolymer transport protein ExbD